MSWVRGAEVIDAADRRFAAPDLGSRSAVLSVAASMLASLRRMLNREESGYEE